MDDILLAIEDYVTNPLLEGALMINGEWGSGKTFFFAHSVRSMIIDRGFSITYLSLNGVSNKDELKKKVFAKAVLTENVGQEQLPGNRLFEQAKDRLARLFQSVEQTNLITSVFDMNDFITHDKHVICLDDLERISDTFKIEELLGYIHSEYIESKNQKIILIGNESKNQLLNEKYTRIKEKVVVRTLLYNPPIQKSVNQVLTALARRGTIVSTVQKNFEFIMTVCGYYGINNLRTVIFCLNSMNRVFKTDINFRSVQKDVIFYLLIIGHEYRTGNTSWIRDYGEVPDYMKVMKEVSNFFTPKTKQETFELNMESPDSSVYERYEKYYSKYTSNLGDVPTDEIFGHMYSEALYRLTHEGIVDKHLLQAEVDIMDTIRTDQIKNTEVSSASKLASFLFMSDEKFRICYEDLKKDIACGVLNLYELARGAAVLLQIQAYNVSTEYLNIEDYITANIEKSLAATKIVEIPDEDYFGFFVSDIFNQIEKYSETIAGTFRSEHQKLMNIKNIEETSKLFQDWKSKSMDQNVFKQILENIDLSDIHDYVMNNIEDRNFMRDISVTLEKVYGERAMRQPAKINKLVKWSAMIEKSITDRALTNISFFWANQIILKIEEITAKGSVVH